MPQTPDMESEFPVIMDACFDNDLSEEECMFLLAVRNAENGPSGNEFGVKRAKKTNLRRQAGEAAASVVKNRERYDKHLRSGGVPNYTLFFAHFGGPIGNGWAPIKGVPEGEAKMNANWPRNVDDQLSKLVPTWMPRIKEWYSDKEMRQVATGEEGVVK